MDEVKLTKVGDTFMITGPDKAAVELAVAELVAKGARALSKVEPLGNKWIVTCEDPQDRSKDCQVIKLGMQLMIKGPTEQVVTIKAKDKEGVAQRWSVEWAGVSQLDNAGIKKESLKVGDDIVIVGNPSRVPGEYRLLMVNLKRPLDGFSWGSKPGEKVD